MKWYYNEPTLQVYSLIEDDPDTQGLCWSTSNRAEKARIVLHQCDSESDRQKFDYDRGQIRPSGKMHSCVMAPLGKFLRLSPCNVDMFGTAASVTESPEPVTSLECPCSEKSMEAVAFCNMQDIEERYETNCEATRHNCGTDNPKIFVECSILELLQGMKKVN
jgi:hypothetical protein